MSARPLRRIDILAHDKGWIEWLRQKYGSELRRFLERMVRNRALAEELEQDTYVKLQHLSEHDIRNPRALLFTTGNNLATSYLTRTRAERSLLEHNSPEQEQVPDTAVSPARAAELDEAIRQLAEAVDALPNKLREVWVMRLIEDRSLDQIAQVLGVTVDAVDQRLRRAMALLRKKLARVGIDERVSS